MLIEHSRLMSIEFKKYESKDENPYKEFDKFVKIFDDC